MNMIKKDFKIPNTTDFALPIGKFLPQKNLYTSIAALGLFSLITSSVIFKESYTTVEISIPSLPAPATAVPAMTVGQTATPLAQAKTTAPVTIAQKSNTQLAAAAMPVSETETKQAAQQSIKVAAADAKNTKPAATTTTEDWTTITIKKRANLNSIFANLNIDKKQLRQVMAAGQSTKILKKLNPGQTIKVQVGPNHQLQQLVYQVNSTDTLTVTRQKKGFQAKLISPPVETNLVYAAATTKSSLSAAAKSAGLSAKEINQLQGIFAQKINAKDLRSGAKVQLLYQVQSKNGKKIGTGDIVAAKVTSRGKTYTAIRYTDPNKHTEYYAADGSSLRNAFTRTPVAYSRISSRFTNSRMHPILHFFRPHTGVDFAAPTGTPIKAAGSGKIAFMGVRSGYGRAITIQHNQSLSSLYGHMSHFAKGVGPGSYVQQGQVIGYVGRSGIASGPHLHFEFRVNGVPKDPLTVALPQVNKVPKAYRSQFLAKARQLLAAMEVQGNTRLAANLERTNTDSESSAG